MCFYIAKSSSESKNAFIVHSAYLVFMLLLMLGSRLRVFIFIKGSKRRERM